MATELHWPRRSTFVELGAEGDDDEERRFIGPGTFEVPDSMVDQYLERGWERPGSDAESTSGSEAETETDGGAEAADAAEAMVPEDEATEESASEPDSEGFDAGAFVDRSWQAVTSDIEDGDADGHLDAVDAAEQERESGPRDSVREAIEARR